MDTQKVSGRAPHSAGLLLKAALKKSQLSESIILPDTRLMRHAAQVQPDHLAGYCDCIGWQEKDRLPPTYLHLMAFQTHLQLMVQAESPFAIIGLVHISNQIEQYRPLYRNETFDLVCYLDNLRPHHRGWQFDLITEAYVGNEKVWRDISTNLSRAPVTAGRKPQPRKSISMELDQSLSLPAQLGRHYARYSGDYNPIHLFALSARAFGFKRHIAHGMWSKARCLAALSADLPERFVTQVRFMRPIFLPAEIELYRHHDIDELHFELSHANRRHVHLQGSVSPISVAK